MEKVYNCFLLGVIYLDLFFIEKIEYIEIFGGWLKKKRERDIYEDLLSVNVFCYFCLC